MWDVASVKALFARELPPAKAFGTARTVVLSPAEGDWLARYKLFIEDGETVVADPHKAWGPQTNDLVSQLRKRKVGKLVLAGMLANPCVESHPRDRVEQGFEVAVVKDATAAPGIPSWAIATRRRSSTSVSWRTRFSRHTTRARRSPKV